LKSIGVQLLTFIATSWVSKESVSLFIGSLLLMAQASVVTIS